MNCSRQENGEFFSKTIQRKGIISPVVRDDATHVYHQYAIRITQDADISRHELMEDMEKKGIGAAIHYPMPIHEQPVYRGILRGSDCLVSEQVSKEIMSIPVYPGLTADQRNSICQAVNGGE